MTTVVGLIRDAIRGEAEKVGLVIADGGCSNIETYKELVGRRKGLKKALDLIQETLKREAGETGNEHKTRPQRPERR